MKQVSQNIKWAVVGFLVTLGILGLFFAYKNEKPKIETNGITATAINSRKGLGPQYFYVNAGAGQNPKVSAEAYVVGDLGTGEIILSKNPTAKFPIASVSKLMTALVAKELAKDSDTAKISKRAVATSGGNGELKAGEKIKVADLVYPLLLESSNDAAEAIAEHFDREKFIAQMNEGAKSLGMMDTSFGDPSGLSIKNQSTAADIFKLTGYLNQERGDVLKITTRRSHSVARHYWSNISQFLNKSGYMGGKSGYTDPARQTVVSVFSLPLGEHVYRPIGITLLRSRDRAKDVETILSFLKKNIYYGGIADANTNWIRERLFIPEVEQNFVDLVFTGDIMLDRGVRASVEKNLSGNYGKLFEKVAMMQKADIVFGNLEGTASDKGRDLGNLYSFHMNPSVVPALKAAGFHVLSLANNHIGDWGMDAYLDTISRLSENEISYTGGGLTKEEAEKPVILERQGTKIGFLGFTDVGPVGMEARVDRPGILLANDPRFEEIVSSASKQVDFLVVSFHWGDEYKPIHNDRQEVLAHKAIDSGAKIVAGHHPHVAQDTEIYTPESCTRVSCMGYIIYSLGNFIFDQKWSQPTMQGLMVEIRLDKQGGITVKKNVTKQNKFFQIDKVIPGKEEQLKFSPLKATSR